MGMCLPPTVYNPQKGSVRRGVIRINPELAIAYYRGVVYGRHLGQYQRAIQGHDEDSRLYYQGSAAYTAIGKSIEAKRDFAKAKELGIEEKEPQSSRLGNVLGFAVRP
jgi:Flp pilus assembly protein TadD